MGKKAKVGKARKDRFYHLAKETGYRSRAAFKLIQLNRKFEFLQKSNVIIDLCAAPGGWLQVAAENAPMSNHIIGIDLVAINPIKNVTTLEEDITTEKCRQALRKQLHTAKADLVLNDGAPNVGTNWLNDAFQQVELTLHALKLATDFLRKGGWFVTKIFRSKDYDSLMWVFQQLFKHVHATKPQASRNESAEIFVVCQGFLAPDKIDPKFLNPKYVFKEVGEEKKMAIDLVHPAKRHRNREGYPEGDLTLFSSLPVSRFISSSDYMNLLAQSSEIKFDSEEIENHPLTTSEIKECLKDIKLLGKSEIKNIFKWRLKLKKALEETNTTPTVTELTENETQLTGVEEEEDDGMTTEEKEIAQLEQMIEEKNMLELREMKKAKKKVKKAQAKQKARIDAKMVIPGDRLDVEGDQNMFDIKRIKNKEHLSEVEGGDLSLMDGTDMFEEDSDDESPKPKRMTFEKGEKKHLGTWDDSDDEEKMEEEPDFEDVDDEASEEENEEQVSNPLLVDLGVKERLMRDHEDTWFSKSAFEDLEGEADEDIELVEMGMEVGKKNRREKESNLDENFTKFGSDDEFSDDDDDSDKDGDSGVDSKGQDENDDEDSDDDDDDDDEDDSDDDSDYDYMEANSLKKKKTSGTTDQKVTKFDGIEVVPAMPDPKLQLNEEGLAIGAAMMQSRKRKRDIIESGYHRFMYDDMGLPDWFVKEEKKFTQRQMPISKAELEEYKMKSKAIDAAPIKKIAEAKARKKKRMLKSLEKARKKANAISDNLDVSEKEKWNQIKHVYKKAGLLKKAKEKVTYVTAKKGAGKKVRRPAGVKGKFKVVDGRMKKDVKSQQKAEMKKQKNSTKRRKQHNAKANRRVRR